MRRPVLSAIVISQNDENTIERSLNSVVEQAVNDPFEVICVCSGADRTRDIVRERFPQVKLVALEQPALPGKARNAGLAVASGDYVSFPGSHVELPPGSLQARVLAHRTGYAMITGIILNGTDTPAGWAAYFLDHADALQGRASEELQKPPSHCSYDRKILMQSGLFPENMRAGEDTVVNNRLWNQGHRAYRDNRVQLYHINRCRTSPILVKHHFVRGRAWGQILRSEGKTAGFLNRYVSNRMRRTDSNVQIIGGDVETKYRSVRHLVRLGVLAAWSGALYELATGRKVSAVGEQ